MAALAMVQAVHHERPKDMAPGGLRPSSSNGYNTSLMRHDSAPNLSCAGPGRPTLTKTAMSSSAVGFRPASGAGSRSGPVTLPPLPGAMAKGASRHQRPSSANVEVVAAQRGKEPWKPIPVDMMAAESYGRVMLGESDWAELVFIKADGGDTDLQRGVLLPAEFAMLVGKLSAQLGAPRKLGTFSFNFSFADADLDGRLNLDEWIRYARKMEDCFGNRRCKKAAMRFLGYAKAEADQMPKHSLEGCWSGIYVLNGYHVQASLRLARECAKWNEHFLVQRVQECLANRADPNCGLANQNFHGYTPLIFLAMAQPSPAKGPQIAQAIHLLVAANADVHRPNKEMKFGQWVPLRFACQMQNRYGVEALLQYIDVGDKFAFAAVEHVQHIMLDELKHHTAQVHVDKVAHMEEFDNEATVLMELFSSDMVGGDLSPEGAIKLVSGEYESETGAIKRGARADPNGAGLEGVTALMNVIKKGDVATVKALLECKASPNQVDSCGATPMHLAAARLNAPIMKLLIEAKGDISTLDHCGFSPWMLVGEQCQCVGNAERRAVQELLELLQPELSAEKILELANWNPDELLGEGNVSPEQLGTRLRLQEQLFYDYKVVRRCASEGRMPRDYLISSFAGLIQKLLRDDPLKGRRKALCKYLLQATQGPKTKQASHVRTTWKWQDNRESYRDNLNGVVQNMLDIFASECNVMRTRIGEMAEENPLGDCAGLVNLPADIVEVPEAWQQSDDAAPYPGSDYWQKVQETQVLRFDPEWAKMIRGGATCCLALIRLGACNGIAAYSRLRQVAQSPMGEMIARGYIKFSNLCNEAFQKRMKAVTARVAGREGMRLKPPEKVVPAKRLKRLMEKTREAREERGHLEWPGLDPAYKQSTYCFHILDTVRMNFTCCGYEDDEEEEHQAQKEEDKILDELAHPHEESEEEDPEEDEEVQPDEEEAEEEAAEPVPTRCGCGNTFVEDDSFCRMCGRRRSKAADGGVVRVPLECTSCSRPMMDDSFYCRHCGGPRPPDPEPTSPMLRRDSQESADATGRRSSAACSPDASPSRLSVMPKTQLKVIDNSVRWSISRAPPGMPEELEKARSRESFGAYKSPDMSGTPYARKGDPDIYFVLDLGKPHHIKSLEIVNAFGNARHYFTSEYEISVANGPQNFKRWQRGFFPQISSTEVQEIPINTYGRYIRMNMVGYGPSGAAIGFLNVLRCYGGGERHRAHLNESVESCMALLREFKSLTLEKDGVVVLRQKSGFAAGVSGSGGYADVKLLMLADLGTFTSFDGEVIPMKIVGEVQLILQGYQEVKDRMHLAYEVQRGSFDK
eukprot:TRINITY_DN28417_c0_g1_i1.p1 TRINITY_DN28417_c0_g1~~TRINITY_DN28417_c0_g1_i1.p1  ORF type:complete len:1314 (-),score=290.42 TRINITY_DN28417_c0_g1_i1:176-4117(-)